MAKGRPKPKRPMYTARERMLYKPCGCDRQNMRKPPQWLLDKIAEEKLTGHYNTRNICGTCFVALPVSGRCINGCNE